MSVREQTANLPKLGVGLALPIRFSRNGNLPAPLACSFGLASHLAFDEIPRRVPCLDRRSFGLSQGQWLPPRFYRREGLDR